MLWTRVNCPHPVPSFSPKQSGLNPPPGPVGRPSKLISKINITPQVWFILLADERGVCRYNCEMPWERVPYPSALEVCSRRGALQIHVYLYLTLPRSAWHETQCGGTFFSKRTRIRLHSTFVQINIQNEKSITKQVAHCLWRSAVISKINTTRKCGSFR